MDYLFALLSSIIGLIMLAFVLIFFWGFCVVFVAPVALLSLLVFLIYYIKDKIEKRE